MSWDQLSRNSNDLGYIIWGQIAILYLSKGFSMSFWSVVAPSFSDNMSDGRVEHWVKSAARERVTLTRESSEFEHVTLVVADKS